MTKVFDEEVVFKQKVFAPQLTIQEGGTGDLSVVDDLFVTDDATIGGDLGVTGAATLSGGIAGDLLFNDTSVTISATGSLTIISNDSSGTITIGDSVMPTVAMYASDGITMNANSAIQIGTDSTFGNAITIGGSNAGQIDIDCSTLMYVGTAGATGITIGNASTVGGLYLYANTAASLDAVSISVGTDTANSTVITAGHSTATIEVHGDEISIGADSTDGAVITIGNSEVNSGGLVDIYGYDYVSINAGVNTAASINMGYPSAGDFYATASTLMNLDAPTISIGTDTALSVTVNIGNAVADTIEIDAATAVNVDALAIGIGADTTITTAIISIGHSNQGTITAAADSVYIDGLAVDICANTAYAAAIDIGNANATSISVVCGSGSASIGGAYVDIGTATTMSNYVTIGAAGGGGSCRIGRQASLTAATVTTLTVSAVDLGKLIVFAGDSTCTMTLPAAEAGIFVDVFVTASTSALTVSAASGDYFVEADGDTASTWALSAFSLYHIVAVDGTRWVATFGSVPDLTP